MGAGATRVALLLVLVGGGACSSNQAIGAALMTASALVETAAYQATTGYRCWAECSNGNYCNERTQMCEPIPCGGGCGKDRWCDETAHPPSCVSPNDNLMIGRDEPAVPLPGVGEARRSPDADPPAPPDR